MTALANTLFMPGPHCHQFIQEPPWVALLLSLCYHTLPRLDAAAIPSLCAMMVVSLDYSWARSPRRPLAAPSCKWKVLSGNAVYC